MGALDMRTTRCYYPHTNEYAPLEWSELYLPGGLHPIDLGQCIDSEKRFEVCHKSGYGDEFTEWFTRDHVQHSWKLVKVFTADESSDDHPELELALALADSPTKVLEDNSIITPSESFWIDGPNGRHLCLVFPVLDHRTPKSIIYRSNPDELVNLCFQVGKAVAFLHKKGICHGNIEEKNVRMIVDTRVFEEKIPKVKYLRKYVGEPRLWPVESVEDDSNPCPYGPTFVIELGRMDNVELLCEPKKVGLLGFDHWYNPEPLLSTPEGRHRSRFPPILHPGREVRDGGGMTGFPSDIWSLACLFGEFRTENEFVRAPEHYGTPMTIDEIKGYLRWGSYRIEPSYYNQGRETSEFEKYSESDNESNVNRSEDDTDSTRGAPQPSTPSASQHKLQSNTVKKDEVPVERHVTRSMARMQQSSSPTGDGTQIREPSTVRLSSKLPTESRKSSKSSVKDLKGGEATSTQHKQQKETDLIDEADNEDNNKSQFSLADVTETPNKGSNDWDKKHSASSVHKSIATPPSLEENTQKEKHRSDIINTEDADLLYYQMPEDEICLFSDLLGKMLAPNRRDRPTIDEVLNHEWFGDRRATLTPEEE